MPAATRNGFRPHIWTEGNPESTPFITPRSFSSMETTKTTAAPLRAPWLEAEPPQTPRGRCAQHAGGNPGTPARSRVPQQLLALGRDARRRNRLCTTVFAQPGGTAQAGADAGLLPPAHRNVHGEAVRHDVVDVDRTDIEPASDPFAAFLVARPHRGRQPILRVVGQPDRLFRVGDLHHRECGPKGLLGHAGHRLIDVDEHRRCEECPGSGWLAAKHNTGARPDRLVDVPLHDVALRAGRQRPDVAGEVTLIVALSKPADPVDHLVHELVVDGRLDVNAFHRDARLTRVEHAAPDDP